VGYLRSTLSSTEDFFLTEGVGLVKEARGKHSAMNKTQEEDVETQMISLDLPPPIPSLSVPKLPTSVRSDIIQDLCMSIGVMKD
jgi:hypothetical protein